MSVAWLGARHVLDLLYPRTCAVCGEPVGDESLHVCWDCLAGLWPIQFPYCSVCGNPVSGCVSRDYVCHLCSHRERGFDVARSAVHFDGPAVDLIHAFKYNHAAHLSLDLAHLLLACVRGHYGAMDIDAVTFVPLYPRRERERTYNQSRLMAAELARALDRPLLERCLVRVRPTPSQTALSAAERRENVRGAFEARQARWIAGRRLLLVDDVMTTGATVDECGRALRHAGAAAVRVVTVARGA